MPPLRYLRLRFRHAVFRFFDDDILGPLITMMLHIIDITPPCQFNDDAILPPFSFTLMLFMLLIASRHACLIGLPPPLRRSSSAPLMPTILLFMRHAKYFLVEDATPMRSHMRCFVIFMMPAPCRCITCHWQVWDVTTGVADYAIDYRHCLVMPPLPSFAAASINSLSPLVLAIFQRHAAYYFSSPRRLRHAIDTVAITAFYR